MPYSSPQDPMSQLIGSLRSARHQVLRRTEPQAPPFVTISRQPGAEGKFGQLLADRLNQLDRTSAYLDSSTRPWKCMDRELVERIASDNHLSSDLINSLEQSSHSFVAEFLKGLSLRDGGPPSDLAVVARVTKTMRALAQAGNVILVGLGGVFMTHDMTGGVHVRLIAPLEFRINNIARSLKVSEAEARKEVQVKDERRIGYFQTFWPDQMLSDELFHVTLNASVLDEMQMADCIFALLKSPARQAEQK